MPLVSVVVPIYNVEQYLRPCLESVARQTLTDLEVVMVDDGSTDGSPAIARDFAERDSRFRLLTKPNGGLSSARNAGADAAAGEFLAFLDSDDVLPLGAYELLATPLQQTGSDFATGNVHRLTETDITPTRFLAKAFERTRLKTHITKFRPLVTDRIAPNKLWRRSFWQSHGYRFPDGMLHEDIPVVLPAHFAAKSVDVIAEPVYLYRVREGADLSITQRRLEKRALLDRVKAVEQVRDYLATEGPRRARRWYEQSVVAEDLSYYLNVLDAADDEYRSLFLERVNAFLDEGGRRLFADLPAIDRLKWHLVRRRLIAELLDVLRFEKQFLRETPPVRVGRRWYGDYPFRTDPSLKIPRSVYRLDEELALSPRVDDLRFEGDELKIGGYAFIAGIGAPEPASQRVTVTVVRRGPLRRIRMRTSAIRLRAEVRHRPEVTASTTQSSADVQWSGFDATLRPRRLKTLGRWRPGTWDLYVTVRAGGVTRRRSRFLVDSPRPVRALDDVLPDGVLVRATPAPSGEIAVHVRERWARIVSHCVADGALELSGRLHPPGGAGLVLRLARVGSKRLEFPVETEGAEFRVRLPLAELERMVAAADPEPHGGEHGGAMVWNLWLIGPGGRERLAHDGDVREGAWPCGERELVLVRNKDGEAALVARARQPVVLEARWADDGALLLEGHTQAPGELAELVLAGRLHLERHGFPVSVDPESGHFSARLTPALVASLAGELPLKEGTWGLYARAREDAPLVPVMLTQTLYGQLPLTTHVGHKRFLLGMTADQDALVLANRDLDDDERGRFHQRRLRTTVYAPLRSEPLREAVLFASFKGRQYSDSPRAIYEELVRREAPLEHLWLVRDGMCRAPAGATAVRSGSREYYEALATARYLVVNDFLPDFFEKREDQICIQTLQGTPLKRVGLDVPHLRSTIRRSWRWAEQVANWQYVISSGGFATPILKRAFGIEGELLETGMPRNDLLAGPDAEARRADARARLGLAEETRAVLYAPTYRDHVVDRRGRYRLDLHLELERLQSALGPGTVLLFRKHPLVADLVPGGRDGFVRDVSTYPDATELLLAADVLVTDYSSLAYDFANTGRPMLFFCYDLETYRDDIRGFYIDFPAEAPGPLVRTTDELADALRSLDEVGREYAARYRSFASSYCQLDDGGAAGRVVGRLLAHSLAAAVGG